MTSHPTTNSIPHLEPSKRTFKVTTVVIDFVGRLISDERVVSAPSSKWIKRQIYSELGSVHSLSIVETTVKK